MSGARDPRIDAYIAKAAPFAQPILTHLRDIVHQTVPDAEETVKWGMPHFTLHGRNVAGMAAFKAHASFGLWRGEELGLGAAGDKGGMGSLGKITSLSDLPDDAALADVLQRAAALAAQGPKKKPPTKPRPALDLPDDLGAALAAVPTAQTVWDGFAPSHRRDYIEWVIEAKRPETRAKRIAQTVAQVAEGKDRNWKYR